jgi:hypothetical protein
MPASCPSDCARERGADGVGVELLRGVLNANCATAPSLRGEGFAARACRWAAGQRRRCKGAGGRALSSPAVQRAAHETRFPRTTERPDRGFWASARRCVARRDAEPGTWLPDLLQLWCAVSNASRPPASPASPRAAPSPPVILSRTPPRRCQSVRMPLLHTVLLYNALCRACQKDIYRNKYPASQSSMIRQCNRLSCKLLGRQYNATPLAKS